MADSLLVTDIADPAVDAAVGELDAWAVRRVASADLVTALADPCARALLVDGSAPTAARVAAERARVLRIPVIVACDDDAARRRAMELRVEEWYRAPAPAEEIAARIRSAVVRNTPVAEQVAAMVERAENERLLHDGLTGLPTLPVAMERARAIIKERGEVVVLYFNFVRYSKIEEVYGWEKLDAVLETTAVAVREFFLAQGDDHSRVMVGFANDDDFIAFHVPPEGEAVATEHEITELVGRLQRHVAARIETQHGEEIAALFDIYVGRAHVYYDPKIRFERLVYRGIREASNSARSIEQRERARKVSDLKASLRERGVYMDYHPIVVAETREIFGYEALARGVMRSLRSPDVMFEVAAEADMVWELSRLCRARAIEGMETKLRPGELLFLNVDPADFEDPNFTVAEVREPSRVVIEITERTAIKDYPRFRERLAAFREMGLRFAVDDAGSGYAGLGSIANLEPDFIKLDISLISGIDSNFIKQNLVQTMVRFANDQGARVIAEGVESREEFETVRQLGVHLVQGFYLHRPQSAEHRVHATAGAQPMSRSTSA